MIRAIIFDLGKVLFIPMTSTSLRYKDLAKKYYKSVKENIYQEFWDDWIKVMTGKIKDDEFYNIIVERLNCTLDEAKSLFVRKQEVNKELRDILFKLKENYKIGVLSNTTKDSLENKKEIWDFRKDVDSYVLSFEDHVKKPDLDAIDLIIKKLDVNKDEVVFIDDHPDTIEKYRNYEVKCVQFSKDTNLEKELKDLGVEI